MTVIRGVDYSARSDAMNAAALKAAGMAFAVRYLADDWRGIDAAEYAELAAGGIQVVAVYEGYGDRRQFSGEAQGITDAVYAQGKLLRTGMPAGMPVYFATDWDAQAWDMDTIAAYLAGAGTVLGDNRVGVYGGYSVIDAMERRGVRWLWQTSAWEYGRGLHPAAHLYQHTYNYFIAGTNCDLTDAYKPHYGQHTDYLAPAKPAYPAPVLPPWFARVGNGPGRSAARFAGRVWYPQSGRVEALTDTYVYTQPDTKSPHAGPVVTAGTKIAPAWAFAGDDGHIWLVTDAGYYYGGKFNPAIRLPEPR